MKPILRRSAFLVLTLAAGIQLVPAGRTNPPVVADLDAPPEVRSILRRACYDCHSNETRWPWYGRVAPVSWILVRDVEAGRSRLNFSRWGEYPEKKRGSESGSAVDAVEEGFMPPKGYVRLHPEAALSRAEIALLAAWADR